MATTPRVATEIKDEIDYPTSDGRPMGETDLHRQDMMDVIATLQAHFATAPRVYVSGNLLLYYERGNARKHISPDVFVVFGVEKTPRDYYQLWKEEKGPDVVVEITSKTTRREDQKKKWLLYRDVLKVPEYFQFDPTEDYLSPPMQGYRLIEGQYVPVEPVAGRLPSLLLGLHLERDGTELRLFDPQTGRRLLTPREDAEDARRHAEEAQRRAEDIQRRAEEAQRRAEDIQRHAAEAERRLMQAEAENERLRSELAQLRRETSGG